MPLPVLPPQPTAVQSPTSMGQNPGDLPGLDLLNHQNHQNRHSKVTRACGRTFLTMDLQCGLHKKRVPALGPGPLLTESEIQSGARGPYTGPLSMPSGVARPWAQRAARLNLLFFTQQRKNFHQPWHLAHNKNFLRCAYPRRTPIQHQAAPRMWFVIL